MAQREVTPHRHRRKGPIMKFIPRESHHNPHTIELTRRNLEVLLAKLDDPGSARTIIDPDGVIAVRAVENEEHYTDRPPGTMLVHGEEV
jgi:hypothetical protein